MTLYDDPETATVDEMTSRLVGAVGPRTRVVAITWVHSSTGVRVPVQEIGAALADLNRDRDQPVLLCVDGVHGFAAVDVDLPDLGCDFLSAGTHKWLFGPRGTGILWARNWGPLTELIPSFSGFENGARLTPGGYHDFEHRWALAEAFAFHSGSAGPGSSSAPSARPPSSRTGCWASAAGRSGSSRPPTRRSRPASSASTSRRCCPATP